MSRMGGVDCHIFNGGGRGSEDKVPRLLWIFIDADLYAYELFNLVGELNEGFCEAARHVKALFFCAFEFKADYMFYHFVVVLCVVVFLVVKSFTCGGYFFIGDIVVVVHHLVDYSVGCKLNDAVAYGLDELVVVA